MESRNLAGRAIGLIVFLVGIMILVCVALLAYNFFTSSGAHVSLTPPTQGQGGSTTSRLGESAVQLVYQVSMLIVLALVGSLVASKGLHLYLGASGRDNPMAHDDTADL